MARGPHSEELLPSSSDEEASSTSGVRFSKISGGLPPPAPIPIEASKLLSLTLKVEERKPIDLDSSPDLEREENSVVVPLPDAHASAGAQGAMPSMPPPVAKLGRYDVLGRLAVGGMAEIYLACENLETGTLRHTVIKVLKRSKASDGDDHYFEELFMREGRTAAQLVHPNICHVYDFGKWSDDFYIAMEWIDGVSLRNVIGHLTQRKRVMPSALAVGIAAQIAGALDYAHNARDARRRPLQVVHLDVNAHNIMLRHDGVVKLLDFGVAQVADPRGESRSDMIKGKSGYMAPEQALQQPLDARVDVFALGICLYEMLTGKALYRRENLRASLEALFKEPVPSVRESVEDGFEALDKIVQKALARNPRDRFQSAREMQAELEAYLARRREVVSNLGIADMMASLYPNAQRRGPAVYRGPDVAQRLAPKPVEAELKAPEVIGVLSAPPQPSPRRGANVFAVGVGLVLSALLLSWWFSRPEPKAAQAGTPVLQPRAVAPRQSEPDAVPVAASRATTQETAVSASEPEPRVAPAKEASEESRGIRRRSSPGFVSDPGF